MDAKQFGLGLIVAGFTLSAVTWIACDSSDDAVTEPAPDSGGGGPTPNPDSGPNPIGDDGGGDGSTSDCFTTPTTYFEIINACTTAVKITKNPTLPLLYPDGGLPPLQ